MRVAGLFNWRWNGSRADRARPRFNDLGYLSKGIIHDFLTYNCPHMAASIAFWGLFSIFPMVLAVVIITGEIISYDSFIERIAESLPVSRQFLTDTLSGVTRNWPYTGTIAAAGLVWASLAVFSAVRKGLNAAWGVTRPRSFFKERLIDFGLMMLAWVVFIFSLSITPIIEFTRNTADIGRFVFWDGTWSLLRVGLPSLLTMGVFMLLYWFIPNTRVRWRDVWPGALIATVSFETLRHGFIWYLGRFSLYNLVYGTAAATVVLLAWAYFSGVILLFGAVVSSRLNKLRRLREQTSSQNGVSSHLDVDMLVYTKTKQDD